MLTYKDRNAAFETDERVACRVLGDRVPFAQASILQADGESSVSGKAEFFYTPLGMFVRVWVRGLEDGAYSLALSAGDIRIFLPPLYAREGDAWSQALTGKISASEMLHGHVDVISYGSESQILVASGRVRSPIVRDTEILRAL